MPGKRAEELGVEGSTKEAGFAAHRELARVVVYGLCLLIPSSLVITCHHLTPPSFTLTHFWMDPPLETL